MSSLTTLMENRIPNEAATWAFIGLLLFSGVGSLANGELLWAGFSAAVIVVALVPTVITRDVTVLVPWEALLFAALPLVARFFGVLVQPMVYFSVAALALLVVIEIHGFSDAKLAPSFAIVFVVLTTMTVAGIWAVVQFFSDALLGTAFLAGPEELMWDLIVATGVGIGAGILFELYFRTHRGMPSAADGVTE